MPKGVDHVQLDCRDALEVIVQKSLMPKGVDHLPGEYERTGYKGSAKIFDAERR